MSSAPHDGPVYDPPRHEDGVNMKLIITVGVVSLVVFALSAVIAWGIQDRDNAALEEARGRAPVPQTLGKDEVGIVDQIEFDADRRLEEWRAAKAKRLSSYGWVDRGKSIIHIPIDKAIDEVVSQAASAPPAGAQQQQP